MKAIDYALCLRCSHDIDEHSALGCKHGASRVTGRLASCSCPGFVLAPLPVAAAK